MIRKILAALCLMLLSAQAFAQGVLLNGTTPVLTRTSASDASPFTFTVLFNSAKFFAGYSEQIQVSTDATFASVNKINLVKTLTEADLITPFTPNFASTADPAPADPSTLGSTYSNTACAGITCYARVRGMARSPAGLYFFTAWSNVISNHDVTCGSVFWNTSAQSPSSSAGFTISGTCNEIVTRASLSGDQLARANTGKAATAAGKSFTVTVGNAGSTTPSIGVTTSTQATNDWVGDASNSVGYMKDGRVFINGSLQFTSTTTYGGGDIIKVMIISGSKLCFQKNATDIQGMNSSTGSGCVSISGTVYPALSTNSTTGSFNGTIDGTNWP